MRLLERTKMPGKQEPRCQEPKKKYKEAKNQIKNTKTKNSTGLRNTQGAF